MNRSFPWYFSRALGVIGLFVGAFEVALSVIMGEGAGEVMASVGTGILLTVGGMLIGAVVDVIIQVRKRSHPREPGRGTHHRKR
jgi:hypothetical protein